MFDKADQLPAHVGLGERVVEDSLAPEIEGVTTVSRVVDINRWLIGFGPPTSICWCLVLWSWSGWLMEAFFPPGTTIWRGRGSRTG